MGLEVELLKFTSHHQSREEMRTVLREAHPKNAKSPMEMGAEQEERSMDVRDKQSKNPLSPMEVREEHPERLTEVIEEQL